MKNDMKP